MFAPLLIAASMLMVSDRANFWETGTISPQTQYGEVNELGITKLLEANEIDRFANKKVLIMVHGFATMEACYPYFTIQANLLGMNSSYDEMIGYIWPCYTNHLAYLDARYRADQVAPRLKTLLTKLQSIGAKVDVAAHSLGNRLVLQALAFKTRSPTLITNFLSIAPAVDNESLEKGEEFNSSTQHIENIFVFYSGRDDVLKWVYPVPELDRALGYTGSEHPARLPSNVQMIDCTAIIDSHDGYLFSKPIFDFIHQAASTQVPSPGTVDHLMFNPNGMFEIISWRSRMMNQTFWDNF